MVFAVVRFIHIIAGIVWAGGAIMMNLVIGPAIGATGDVGRQFAGHLMSKTPVVKVMLTAGLVTVLAGTYLYGVNSNWFTSGWMHTGPGIGFGIGAFAGDLALIFGFMVGSANGALARLGSQIQGKPTDEQTVQMQALQKRSRFVTNANTICVIIAIVMMSSARFLG